MVLRRWSDNCRRWIMSGNLCLAVALMAERVPDMAGLPPVWHGVLDGFSVPLVVASIIFNLRGLSLYRKSRRNSPLC